MGDSQFANNEIPNAIDALIGTTHVNVAIAGRSYGNGVQQATDLIALNPDIIILPLGTNDFGITGANSFGVLGTYNDTTFTSCVYKTHEYLATNFAGKPIIICTPFQRNFPEQYPGKNPINIAGHNLKDYVDRIKIIAEMFSIQVLDFHRDSGITLENLGLFSTDGLHVTTTQKGRDRATYMLIDALNKIFMV